MIRGSEVEFKAGASFKASGKMFKKVANIKKTTMSCPECRKYRVKIEGFQNEGDICRYCRRSEREAKLNKKAEV